MTDHLVTLGMLERVNHSFITRPTLKVPALPIIVLRCQSVSRLLLLLLGFQFQNEDTLFQFLYHLRKEQTTQKITSTHLEIDLLLNQQAIM